MLCRMREIQHAHGIRSMQVNKALNPVCPIGDGADSFGLAHSSSVQFHWGYLPKGLCVRHTRKVGQVASVHLTLSCCGELFFHLPNGYGSDLCPCSSNQRNIGSIDADSLVLTVGLGS